MKHHWRVYFDREPTGLSLEQFHRWLDENTEIVTADKPFITNGNCLTFAEIVTAPESEPDELCGETCKNGKPCVRKKDHPVNKRWGHMHKLAPKKEDRAELLTIKAFPPGSWDGGFQIVRE